MQWPKMPSTTATSARVDRIDPIARLFRSRWHQGYARGKLKHDPVFDDALGWARRAELAASDAVLLDAGCGLGLLAHWLRAHDVAIPIRGIDPDAKKIAAAREAAERGGLRDVAFEIGDAREAIDAIAGSFFLLDVLHYLPLADRDRLLERAAARAAPGGVIYLRNGLRDQSWRHRFTRMEEWFVRHSGWIPTRGFRLPDAAEITRHFPTDQFASEVGPLWGKTPFNSHRLAFVRRR